MRPVLLALALMAVESAVSHAADPATMAAATGAATAIQPAAPGSSRAPSNLAHQDAAKAGDAAKTAAAAALARPGAVRALAHPAPHYVNYTLANSRDTFEICKNQSGLKREISLEELLPIYGLPQALLQHRHVTLETLVQVLSGVAPSARLVIAPLLAGEAELAPVLHPDGKLPRLVHFTVREKDAMLPHQAVAIATWARLNPGYSILMYDDADIAAFMSTYHPHLLPLFHRLSSQVERTDLWRYLVLCTFGGVYADSDVVAGRPVSTWAQDAGLLTGVENVFESMEAALRRDYTQVMQIVQWVMAARAGHPAVCRMGEYIQRRLDAEAAGLVAEADRDHAILERTGPGIWSKSVHDYLKEHGVVPESMVGGGKVGDLRLLPQSTFGCASSTVNLEDPIAYVYHMFKGSWRLHESKLWQFISHLYQHLFDVTHQGGAMSSPKVEAAAGRDKNPARQQQQQQQIEAAVAASDAAYENPKQQAQLAANGGSGSGTEGQVVERRLHEQLTNAAALQMQLQPVGLEGADELQHNSHGGLPIPPLASLLLVGMVCAAAAQRSGKCSAGTSSGAGSGRTCEGLRQSASGALTGIWGGARRLAGRMRGSGAGGALGSSGGGGGMAALLPVSLERPLLGGGGSGGLVVAGASTATRQQGGSTGGCLKRSTGSTQQLSNLS